MSHLFDIEGPDAVGHVAQGGRRPGLSLSDKIAADPFGRARSKLSLLLAYTTARSSEIPLPG